MAQTMCTALNVKGLPCSGKATDGLCKVHLHSRYLHGPHTFERMQLINKQKNDLDKLWNKLRLALITEVPAEVSNREYNTRLTILKGLHATELNVLAELQKMRPEEEKRMEYEAQERQRARKEKARLEREERNRRRLDALTRAAQLNVAQYVVDDIEIDWDVEDAPVRRNLRDIADDPQGVHTTEVVTQTKEIVAKVRSVPVPEGYQWDPETCSKTPGEIIAECKLSQKAAWQMMSQYAQDTAIYDIEAGIYGKVLDSVWQFVKNHAEKESLVTILRTELNDNIGMCAQGNLTRICNILSGYLDGVGSVESLAETLGRLLPPLRDIADEHERIKQAITILREHKVPDDQWDTWIEAVME